MACVACPKCDILYDNAQRWTFCPHNRLEDSPWRERRDSIIPDDGMVAIDAAIQRALRTRELP
jgi:hypothetical protein